MWEVGKGLKEQRRGGGEDRKWGVGRMEHTSTQMKHVSRIARASDTSTSSVVTICIYITSAIVDGALVN